MYSVFHEYELGPSCQAIQVRGDRLEKIGGAASTQFRRGSLQCCSVESETGDMVVYGATQDRNHLIFSGEVAKRLQLLPLRT